MVFEVSLANLINIIMISTGIGVSILFILQIRKAPIHTGVRSYFIYFLQILILYLVAHLGRQLLEGIPSAVVSVLIRIVTFIEFTASGFLSLMLVSMILYLALPDGEKKNKYYRILLALTFINTAALLISSFTDLFYTFDAMNIYHRTPLYFLSNLCPLIMLVQGMTLLIRHPDRFEKNVSRAFWIYLLTPFGAAVLQAFFSEIQFVIFATVGAAINMFAVIVGNLLVRYESQQIEASRIETELSMATKIQANMLPNIFPAFPEREEIDIFASMTPAKEVGGDFYDFFLIDDDHLGLVVADVAGKGVPAALFMMASKILIQNYAVMHREPAAALEAANRQICQSNDEDMFVTVWLGILDLQTGVLTAANAGHEYPVLKKPGEKFELYHDKHGFVVGGLPGMKYKPYEIQMEKGTTLFLYTDGVPEAVDPENHYYGTGRLLNALNKNPDAELPELVNTVKKDIQAFAGKADQFDDLTVLVVKYNGTDSSKANG